MLNTRLGRITIFLFLIFTLVMLGMAYEDAKDARSLLYLQKDYQLLELTTQLDAQLPAALEPLFLLGNRNDPAGETLRQRLQPLTDQLADRYPGMVMGYSSKDLDSGIAVSPAAEPFLLQSSDLPHAPALDQPRKLPSLKPHPSQLAGGIPILALQRPLYRNDRLIGYTFAYYKMEELEKAFRQDLQHRLIRILWFWLFVISLMVFALYRLNRAVKTFVDGIQQETPHLPVLDHYPEFRPILATVMRLRKKILADHQVIRDSNNKLAKLIEYCPLAILELDDKGDVVTLNKAMVDFYQLFLSYKNKEEIIGKNITDLAAQLGIPYEQSFIAQVLKGQEIKNYYHHVLNRDFILHGVPIYDPKTHALSGAIAIYHDITEYQKIKTELSKLECRHAIGETASSVAHEIRNIITPVKGYLQLFLKRNQAPENSCRFLLEELERLNDIVDHFLSLAQNRYIERKPCSLSALLCELQPILASECADKQITLTYQLAEASNLLQLNTKEIRQLVLNLARNSMDAMNAQGELSLATEQTELGITLTIRDTGCGIPPELLPRIFDPFFTTKKNTTGLGLPVCQNIVAAHDGKITVVSEVGRGTSCTIFFPFSAVPQA